MRTGLSGGISMLTMHEIKEFFLLMSRWKMFAHNGIPLRTHFLGSFNLKTYAEDLSSGTQNANESNSRAISLAKFVGRSK